MSMNLGSVYKGPTENNMQSPGGSKFSDERGSADKSNFVQRIQNVSGADRRILPQSRMGALLRLVCFG